MKELPRLVVIGASTGGLGALRKIVSGLPAEFPAAVLVAVHIGNNRSVLPELLAAHSALAVRHAADGEILTPGTVLIAPPDRHLLVTANRVQLSHGPKENFARPAIDPLFRSAAIAHRECVIGIVLTGTLDDGTVGLQAIKAYGGMALVQDPAGADAPGMPLSALEHVEVDLCLPLDRIADELVRLVDEPIVSNHHPVSAESSQEDQFASGGLSRMEDLDKIANPSAFTCPECGGSLWEIEGAMPQRFRCHVGHGYTAQTLIYLQDHVVEDALWAAVRALHEKENLLKRFATSASEPGKADAAAEYERAASRSREAANVLVKLIAR